MVTVTADDLRHVQQLERELAAEGREGERIAIRKALTLLRRAAIEGLEGAVDAKDLPRGVLPGPDEPPLRTLSEPQEQRLATLLAASSRGALTPTERRELQALLDVAEERAMRNVLALVRAHAPESDIYEDALRAYKRTFARFRPGARGRRAGPASPAAPADR